MVDALRRIFASASGLGLLRPGSECVSERLPHPAASGHRRRSTSGALLLAVALAAGLISLTSCASKQAAANPPEPEPRITRAPRPAQPSASGPVSEPQTVTALPSPQPVPPNAVPDTPGPLVNQPEVQASSEPEPTRPRPTPTAPPVASESAAPPETPAASVPQLGQIMSAAQRRQYNQLIDQAIARAQERLKLVAANTARLNEEQHTTLKRIQAFIQQAEEKRKGQDLPVAKNLADRALLLAEDLAKNFK